MRLALVQVDPTIGAMEANAALNGLTFRGTLNFSGNALGPIGLFAVPALNASNDNAVSQADRGAKAFTDVQSNLKVSDHCHGVD